VLTLVAPALGRDARLSPEDARRIVDEFEARQASLTPADPLHRPRTVDDIEAILKRDQIDLFRPAVEAARALVDPRALALEGQIELAWGEAQHVLSDLLVDLAMRRKAVARPLELREPDGALLPEDARRLDEMRRRIEDETRLSDALSMVGMQHLSLGGAIAQRCIRTAPGSYLGYRLAADFHRLQRMWTQFDRMVARIAELNAASNGLLFLRGMAALERDADLAKARGFLRRALERDPAFVRAQVEILLSYPFIGEAWGEYLRLKAMNPRHQIVVWAEPFIEEAHRADEMQRKALQGRARGSAPPPAARGSVGSP